MLTTALTSVSIRTATRWDILAIADVLTTAAVAVAQWTTPDRVGRALLLYDAILDRTRHAVRNGTVLLAEHGTETIGAIIWSHCPAQQADLSTVSPGAVDGTAACLLRGPEPSEEPHWDLRGLGVLPGWWRQHVGTALLDAWHQKPNSVAIARAAVAVPGAARLFAKHGYEFTGAIRPAGWDDGPVLQRLWRPTPSCKPVRSRDRTDDGRRPGR
jgi:GNAT superfamily N-acetyltransferase